MASLTFLNSGRHSLKNISRLFGINTSIAATHSLQQHSSIAATCSLQQYSPLAYQTPCRLLCHCSSGSQNTQFYCSARKKEGLQNFKPLYSFGNSNNGTILERPVASNVIQIRAYKAVLRPRLICDGCYFAWRHGRKHVECSDHPRHKQMKRIATRKLWKEDYSEGNIQKALWHDRMPHRCVDRTVDRTVMSHNWLAGKLGKEL